MSGPENQTGTASEASGLTVDELRAWQESTKQNAHALRIKLVFGRDDWRDLFAAFALAGQLAEGDTVDPAKWAYRYADMMLAEREKRA